MTSRVRRRSSRGTDFQRTAFGPGFFFLALVLALVTRPSWAVGPADELLRLVPADSGATLVIEDLRDHARTFLESPLADALCQLPNVKAWLASDGHRKYQRAREELQKGLKVELASLRDDLLGDAVVLSLRVPEGAEPDGAQGLLLVRVRDRVLLDRLIDTINTGEKHDGVLLEVVKKAHAGVTYQIRKFRPGAKPDETYAILANNVLAWSNSETLVREAIDRQTNGEGLSRNPRFRAVREALPEHSLASFFVDPRFVERVSAASSGQPPRAPDDLWNMFFSRYLAAVTYAGASLEWRDGFVLQLHELIDPAKLDEPLRRWVARTGGAPVLVSRVPPTALALAALHVDGQALFDEVMARIPETGKRKAENLVTFLRGILLGKDPRTEILNVVGPGMVVYVDAPRAQSADRRPALVFAFAISGVTEQVAGASAAIENALNTVFAMTALDNKLPENSRLRVETREIDGIRVTGLAGGKSPLSFAVGPGFIVLGNVPEAVAAFAADSRPSGDAKFAQIREEFFPKAESFAYADFERLGRFATEHRAALVRRVVSDQGKTEADAGRDLDQALALMRLFRAGFATSTVAANFSSAHRTVGLLAQPKP